MASIAAVAIGFVFAAAVPPAHADIYTWVDKKGVVNVSNLPPPDDVKVTSVARAAPKDAAREAAQREAARQAEVRVLSERVEQLKAEVDQSRREASMPPPYAPPPVAYMPPPAYPPIIINMASATSQPAAPGGCDGYYGDCGFAAWPGYYGFGSFGNIVPTYVIPPRGGKAHRRWGPQGPPDRGQLIPPLIPTPRAPGGRMG